MIFLSGCATTGRTHVDSTALKSIDHVEIHLGVAQAEIRPSIKRSNLTAGAGGGLLWAAIDASLNESRTKEAETMIRPLRDTLIDYDFNKTFENYAGGALKDLDWLNNADVKLDTGDISAEYMKSFDDKDNDAVIFVTTDYYVSADYKTIRLLCHLSVFPNNINLYRYRRSRAASSSRLSTDNAMYDNRYIVEAMMPASKGTPEQNLKDLTKNDGALVKRALDLAEKHMASMLAFDVKHIWGGSKNLNTTPDIAARQRGTIDGKFAKVIVFRKPNGFLLNRFTVGS